MTIKKSDIICIIPARGGSQGLKMKNLRTVNKKKLIPSYSIDNDKQEDDIEFETFTKKNKNKNNREETNYFDVEMEFSEDDETEPQSLKYDDFGNII